MIIKLYCICVGTDCYIYITLTESTNGVVGNVSAHEYLDYW